MSDAEKGLAGCKRFLPGIPGQGRGRRKGGGKGKVVAVILAAALGVAALTGIGGRKGNPQAVAALQASAVKSAEVKKGSIATTVSGTGTLAADDTEDIELLSLVSVDSVYVEAGDRVIKGQRLATVDPLSVRQALSEIQEKLEKVDDELEEAQDDELDSVIESRVSGRVKKLYAKKGDSVASVMQKHGALMLLSLDGKMAVTVETDKKVTVGDTVQVALSDKKEKEGMVAAVGDGTVTVTLTDDGTKYDSEVQVYDGKTWLGAGRLRINSELKVTGYAGTVETVKVTENQKVKDGTDLYKLEDLPHTAEYERLLAERAELADTLQELMGLYHDGTVYAEKDGTIQSVNCEGAKIVKDGKSSPAGDDSPSTDDGSAESGADSASKEESGNKGTARNDGNLANPMGTGGAAQGAVKTLALTSTGAAAGIRTSEEKTGSALRGASNSTVVQEPAGAGSADAQSPDKAGSSADSGMDNGGSETDPTGNAGGADSQNPDGAGNTSGTGNAGSSDAANGVAPGQTDSNPSGGDSSTEGNTPSGDGSSSGSGSSSDIVEGDERMAITSLSAITIADPVAGETVQRELILAGNAAYDGTLTWSPKADKTYKEGTSYTATVALTAQEGYYFDADRMQDGQTAISNGAGGKTPVTKIGKIGQGGSKLTFTVVYPETAAVENEKPGNTSGGVPSAGGFSWSGGSKSASPSVYSTQDTAGTGTDTTDSSLGSTETNDTAHTAIFTQSADKKMAVTVSVDELDILSLQEGQTAQVTLDAIENEVFAGTVTEIHTLSDTSGNGVTKYSAIVELDKTERMLAGMNASVTVTVSENSDCLTIPEEALNEYGNRVTVYTAYDESTGELSNETEVSTGVSNGTNVEITNGLAEGDTVYYRVSMDSGVEMDAPFVMTAPGNMPEGDFESQNRRNREFGDRPNRGGGPGEAK